MEISDNDLIERFKTADERAFREIFNRFYPRLLLTTHRIIRPIGTNDDAKEIVLDVLQELFNRREGFDSLKAVNAFVYLAARRDCIDFLRKKGRAVEKTYDLTKLEAANDELDVALIDRALEEERVLKMVRDLPSQSKKVVVLHYLNGMKYREIAEHLNISPRTVENLLRFALKRLRNALNDKTLVQTMLVLSLSLAGSTSILLLFLLAATSFLMLREF